MCCNSTTSLNDYLAGDQTNIVVNGILQPDTNYVWEVTDGYGNMYYIPFTTNSEGLGTIDSSQLPDNFINAHQLPVTIKAKRSVSSCDYEKISFIQKFESMKVEFKNNATTKGYIGCAIDILPPSNKLPFTYRIRTTPSNNALLKEKPVGNTLQDNELIGKTPWPFIIVDNQPLQWAESGITFNSTTGTFDFSAYNPLVDGQTINVPYYEV